jgi:ABC-type sugar transport system ATPase subunit
MTAALLEVRDLCKSYDGRSVLDRVALEVRAGEVQTLAGENGAGKSTLVKILSGIVAPDSGQIRLAGQLFEKFTSREARRHGIAVVHQDFDLAPNLTVAQNLLLGNEPKRFAYLINGREERRLARTQLEAARVDVDPDMPVAALSVAQRQLVAIAKSVAARARLLILDEPTSSLSAADISKLLDAIRRQRAAGAAVLFISHKLDEVFAVSDRITVFRDGRNVGMRNAEAIDADELVCMMVGRKLEKRSNARPTRPQSPRLELQGIQASGLRGKVSLTVGAGEVLGLYGLRGSGRTALLRGVFGLAPLAGGSVLIDGQPVALGSPQRAIRAGVAWVCRDRKERGILPNMSVTENMTLAALNSVSRYSLVRNRKEDSVVQHYVQRLGIRMPGADRPITALSGGNQQKVLLARWLMCKPRLLVLDEPTVGIDVGAKSEIYTLIDELAATGTGILLVSSELPEILTLSDRICVMQEGAIVGSLGRAEATEVRVLQIIHGRPIS